MAMKFPEISIENLSVGYRTKEGEKRLVEGFTTCLKAGEVIALMGSNGCGKSTLLRTITGFQQPLDGSVTIQKKLVSAISMKDRAGYISYVSTEPVRVGNMSVFDLVGLGRYLYSGWWGSLSDADNEAVNRCLRLTGMAALAERQVNSLSDGERQRAMIARALAQDTPVIILDEPTAFLDIRNKYEIIHLLRDLAEQEQKSVIFSSHDFNITMGLADKVWLVDSGKIRQGAPEDLALDGAYNSLLEGSSLMFAPQSGEITMTGKPVKGIHVVAEGNIANWLTKALLRKGFCADKKADRTIIATFVNNRTVYSFSDSGHSEEFISIYDLLERIGSR